MSTYLLRLKSGITIITRSNSMDLFLHQSDASSIKIEYPAIIDRLRFFQNPTLTPYMNYIAHGICYISKDEIQALSYPVKDLEIAHNKWIEDIICPKQEEQSSLQIPSNLSLSGYEDV